MNCIIDSSSSTCTETSLSVTSSSVTRTSHNIKRKCFVQSRPAQTLQRTDKAQRCSQRDEGYDVKTMTVKRTDRWRECVPAYSSKSHSTHDRTLRRRVISGNRLHDETRNNQRKTHTKRETKSRNTSVFILRTLTEIISFKKIK